VATFIALSLGKKASSSDLTILALAPWNLWQWRHTFCCCGAQRPKASMTQTYLAFVPHGYGVNFVNVNSA